jgi:hypothetical protein
MRVRSQKSSAMGVVAVAVMLAAVLVSAPAAFAQSGWWHLSSGTRPGYIKPGSAHDQVQELVTAPGAILGVPTTAFELYVGDEEVGLFLSEPEAKALGIPAATAANIQQALEHFYGQGNVAVTGGEAGGQPGSLTPLVVTNIGAKADLPAEKLQAYDVTGEGSALVKLLDEGKPDGEIYLTAVNTGNAAIGGAMTPVRIVDKLPHGVKAVKVIGTEPGHRGAVNERDYLSCSVAPQPTCTTTEPLGTFDQLEVRIPVIVEPGASGSNEAAISGGNAPSASFSRSLSLSEAPTPAGVENYELTPEEENGVPATQAGAHPFQLTTTLVLNQGRDTELAPPLVNTNPGSNAEPVALAKDLNFKWPPGLVGNPTPLAQCTAVEFITMAPNESENLCPEQSVVGVATVTVNTTKSIFGVATFAVPLFNLVPRVGEPARFGFTIPTAETQVYIDTSVRTGSDYGITVNVNNITQTAGFIASSVTVWGVPGDPRHDHQRGWACLYEASKISSVEHAPCEPADEAVPPPFIQLPTSCTGPLETSVENDTWEDQKPVGQQQSTEGGPMPALDGCNRAPFNPSIKVTPDGTAGSTPTGLNVDVHNPQEGSLNPTGLAEPDVKDITVTLPEGFAINPAGGDGLEACTTSEIGFLPSAGGESELLHFTSGLPQPFCPAAAKIGTAKIKTPLLPNPLEGAVYLATQDENPFGSLVAMYMVAEDPISGVLVKLAGQVHLSESGRIVTTFANNPQLPFEDAELHFFGGERAPLASPARCGAYTTSGSFAPWTGTAPATPSSTFDVTSGPNGSPCPGSALPFTPSLTGGTTSIQAGGFSPFTMTMSRPDGNQPLQAVDLRMPLGLSGLLSNVELCREPQADEGLCPAGSLIGETTVSVGVGGDPFSVTGGKVYLTGPYDGAPFGLSIVNPAKAGPFDLENTASSHPPCDCVLVRAKIEVNPITAQLTVTTDDSGPYKIPTILEGVPLQIQHVNVTINRPKFMFNPTNCNKLELGGSIDSSEGASQALSVPFQATNCAVLKFEPKVAVATGGKASKANGASLHFDISYPKGAQGSEPWFSEAKFSLPKQLPARLTTLQQACLAATFEANPAACPAHALIGHAVVHTQVLPVPLEGPVYFVSYGGAKFPEAVIVLHGYGVTVDLHGETFISNAGVTSATFRNTPDVPFESIEVSIPMGPYSEFGANLPPKDSYSFCGQKLVMPTLFKAQNGLEFHKETPIGITGCAKTSKRAQTLAATLKACKKKHNRKRAVCERTARTRYALVTKHKRK